MQQQFTGKQYLGIDIASSFGLDKDTWDQRLEWFNQHEAHLESMRDDADEPALFDAGVRAWRMCQNGIPSGYPISLDATSSGMQLLACMTGDRKAASLCNVINRGIGAPERADAYTIIYHMMLKIIGESGKITRSDTKSAIMTALYGSEAEPKRVFGEGVLLNVFHSVMGDAAPAVWELNTAFLNIWDPEATEYSWIMPDNFHVHTKVMDVVVEEVHFLNEPFEISRKVQRAKEKGRSLCANTTHSVDGMIVREMTRRCNYDVDKVRVLRRLVDDLQGGYIIGGPMHEPDEDSKMVEILWSHYQKSGYLSTRILDHLHAHNFKMEYLNAVTEILNDLPAKPFEIISVHDCFRCLPNYGNDLRRQYQLQLYYIGRSEMLSFLLTQIMGREIKVGKQDPMMFREILEAEYPLS